MAKDFHVTDLIPAYVLDCLHEDEAAAVSEHLASCAFCRAELRSYQEVSAELAYSLPQVDPPARVKSALMDRVRATERLRPKEGSGLSEWASGLPEGPGSLPRGETGLPRRASGASSWLDSVREGIKSLGSIRIGPAWGLVGLVLVLALVASNVMLWRQLNALQASNRATAMRVVALSGTETAPGATGLIVVSLDGRHGTLVVDNLPELDAAHQYQLWLIKDGQRTSGAVFSVGEDGYGSKWVDSPEPLADYTSFGVTVEPEGGSPAPTGEKVLGGNF